MTEQSRNNGPVQTTTKIGSHLATQTRPKLTARGAEGEGKTDNLEII